MRQAIADYADGYISDGKIKSTILWWNVFDEAGYPQVHVNNWNNIMNHDSPATQWCNEHVGRGDYYIAGQAVFFTRDEDAVNFALRWS
jgi:hypothetical protein